MTPESPAPPREPETDGTDLPVCPHCGTADPAWWEGGDRREDTPWQVVCGECGGRYEVRMLTRITFDTELLS